VDQVVEQLYILQLVEQEIRVAILPLKVMLVVIVLLVVVEVAVHLKLEQTVLFIAVGMAVMELRIL
tara:strand:- start:377 stop:574 length:198 start_codon:yes stop_codon:yes gene_type:complete